VTYLPPRRPCSVCGDEAVVTGVPVASLGDAACTALGIDPGSTQTVDLCRSCERRAGER